VLQLLRDLFDDSSTRPGAGANTRTTLELAAAALLVEVARIDGTMQATERAAVLRAIHEQFALSDADAEALLRAAEAEMKHAAGYFPFTSLINQQFSQPQKEHLLELMWRAAYADDELSAHELHLMRKLAGLLHVGDNEYIAAKLRAKDAQAKGA
jgi:uncharacterized tellurite resistance protein B-like protein